jgi:hypothetical protein
VRVSGSRVRCSRLKFLALATIATLSIAPMASAHTAETAGSERLHIRRRARGQIGAPYRYGGTSPKGFDCSGFTRWVFRKHGARLPHNSFDQFRLAKHDGYRRIHKRKNLKVGDLVFHKTTGGGGRSRGHLHREGEIHLLHHILRRARAVDPRPLLLGAALGRRDAAPGNAQLTPV